MLQRDEKVTAVVESGNRRHGITLPSQRVATTFADLPDIFHYGVPQNTTETWKSAGGGVARNEDDARLAAISEALERYSAFNCRVPERCRCDIPAEDTIGPERFSLFTDAQREAPDFPFAHIYDEQAIFTNVFSLHDNSERWVHRSLVGLGSSNSVDDNSSLGLTGLREEVEAGIGTSSGLAAGFSGQQALLRALQELIERDALMVSWLHGVPGRRVNLGDQYTRPVLERGGEVMCFNATPAYSPHPVAVIAGTLPIRGKPRRCIGAACRATWNGAVEKAYLEWAQGIFFAGYYAAVHPDLRFNSYEDVDSFDYHAVYYTIHPEVWNKVPLFMDSGSFTSPPLAATEGTTSQQLRALQSALEQNGIEVFYRDLTTVDLEQIGLSTVRAISPQMTPIFCHQRFPFLGGTTADVEWRFPWVDKSALLFPNPLPHPLG
jgi:ribosomal protein S12 methylthiotransferase accessory factor